VTGIRPGIDPWSQATGWPAFVATGQAADRLDYEHLWTWDHVLPIFGDLDQPILEGYSALAQAPGHRGYPARPRRSDEPALGRLQGDDPRDGRRAARAIPATRPWRRS
jgi:hypothetical protein